MSEAVDPSVVIAGYLDRGLDFVIGVVHQVPAEKWDDPSPCEDWSARQVLGHLIGVQRIGLDIMAGKPVAPSLEPVPVGSDPAAEWDDIAGKVRETMRGVDLNREVESPRGKRTIAQGVAFPVLDLFMHSWDIGKATGVDVQIPNDVVEYAFDFFGKLPEQMLRTAKTFGPEQRAPEGADATTRLMAFAGRRVS